MSGPNPNTQAEIERDVRITIGDLHVQLIVANRRIQELEAELAILRPPEEETPPKGKAKPNGGEQRPT